MTPPIIVVSGLPRSGTSLMMQMLEAGGMPLLVDGVRVADEDNPRGYFEFEAVKAMGSDASFLEDAPGRAVKIVAPLLRFLPAGFDYRVIMMEREMSEVLDSQAKMIERSSPLAAARGGKPNSALMSEAFESVLARVDQFVADSPNMNVLRIAHRAVVEDPRAAAKSVSEFLVTSAVGVDLMESVEEMAAVVAPDLYRARG